MADLAALIGLEASFPGDRMSAADLARFVEAPNADVWVAEREDAVIADAIVVYGRGSHVARLCTIAVDVGFRGRGVGTRLMRHLELEAARRGCGAMRLEVRVDNLAARRLYEALGYELMGTRAGYYEDGSAAQHLRKPLGRDRLRRPSLSGAGRRGAA